MTQNHVPISVQLREMELTDFDEIAQVFRQWDVRFRQLDRGAFHGRIRIIRIGEMEVLSFAINRVIHAEGVPPTGSFLVTPVSSCNQGANWRGQTLRAGQVNVLGPSVLMDHRTTAPYRNLSIRIPASTLESSLRLFHGDAIAESLQLQRPHSPSPRTLSVLQDSLHQVLSLSADSASYYHQPATASDWECRLSHQILACFTDSLTASQSLPSGPERQLALRRAIDFIKANLTGVIRMRDLCRVCDVSERTLDYAFKDRFGLSPMRYVKVAKLNAVRHSLKQVGRTPGVVQQIAREWGFTHPGAFAADYERHFGQLPSQTLRLKT